MAPRLHPALSGLIRYARVDQIRTPFLAEITSLASYQRIENPRGVAACQEQMDELHAARTSNS
jgi:hypothetical protein